MQQGGPYGRIRKQADSQKSPGPSVTRCPSGEAVPTVHSRLSPCSELKHAAARVFGGIGHRSSDDSLESQGCRPR